MVVAWMFAVNPYQSLHYKIYKHHSLNLRLEIAIAIRRS